MAAKIASGLRSGDQLGDLRRHLPAHRKVAAAHVDHLKGGVHAFAYRTAGALDPVRDLGHSQRPSHERDAPGRLLDEVPCCQVSPQLVVHRHGRLFVCQGPLPHRGRWACRACGCGPVGPRWDHATPPAGRGRGGPGTFPDRRLPAPCSCWSWPGRPKARRLRHAAPPPGNGGKERVADVRRNVRDGCAAATAQLRGGVVAHETQFVDGPLDALTLFLGHPVRVVDEVRNSALRNLRERCDFPDPYPGSHGLVELDRIDPVHERLAVEEPRRIRGEQFRDEPLLVVVDAAACGLMSTFGMAHSGLSAGSGSVSKTSRAANPILPSARASTRAGSSTVAPRPTLTSVAPG